jgi:hypothetical protein
MSDQLWQALEQVARRFRTLRFLRGLAVLWLTLAAIGWGMEFGLDGAMRIHPYGLLGILLGLAVILATAWRFIANRSVRDPHQVARRIEARYPELGAGLLAAIDELDAAPSGRLGFLQSAVVREVLEHRSSHEWDEAVPTRKLARAQVAHIATLALLIVMLVRLGIQGADIQRHGSAGFWLGSADSSEVQVDPGDTELERGSSLLVIARFPRGAPADATLVVEGGPQGQARRPMTRSLADPMFAGRVESVESDLAYRVEFSGRGTETYRVHVFEYPELRRADAHLAFPAYTGLAPKVVEDIRHVTAVEGTELTLLCRLNKDVSSATLVEKEGQTIALTRDDSTAHTYRAVWKLADPGRYHLKLVDADGRTNPMEPEIVVNVTRNRSATVKMTQPSHDVQVSPLEELALKAQIDDDFGVVRHGLSYGVAGQEPKEIVLAAPDAKKPAMKLGAEHMLDFEAMHAAPDQLVSYFFWAEDIGPDGQHRRASGDMFFAEVRHFEEIFRQGEQPPGGSAQGQGEGENGREAGRLAELQKQIINATWNLIRRETGSKPTEPFAADSKTIQESQKAVIDQAAQMGPRLRDQGSKAALGQAITFMKDALKRLTDAADNASIKALRPALSAEQGASQALLKLRAREHQVMRGSRSRGGGGGSASNRQLQQLQLSNDENRYEEQRTARSEQQGQTRREREQSENRQILSRLRELAQRQNDLNERLKELQSALEAARTPQAREEIERQLKRLREQQQEILRDTDELRERMENEENAQRLADARQQMEQGREHVREASRALEEGRLPQALTEGARAGRQLNDLREQLRKETSNRFAQEMTDLREQARRLDEDQKKIAEQLDAWDKNPQHSLRDTDDRKQVRQGVEQQRQRLDQVLDRMRNTTQEAEETEPLLAKGLYDTVRKAGENKIPDALKATQQLVDLGVAEEATKAAHHAERGIEQLRQGVDRAAQSVLGDDTAALRRAQSELDDLADQVDREIARATGREPRRRPDRQGETARERGQSNGADQQGQQGQQPGQQGQQGGPERQQGEQGQQQGQQGERGQRGQQGQQRGQQGQRPGRQGEQGDARGQQGQQGQGEQQGRQDGQQAGQQGQQGQQAGQRGQRGQQGQGGQRGEGDQQGQPGSQQDQQGQQPGGLRGGGTPRAGGGGGGREEMGLDRFAEGIRGGPAGGPGGPITGDGFRQWSDRMRDVEELLQNPEWRAEASRIRDRVRGARDELRRHSQVPDWTKLQTLVAQPLEELRNRIADEVHRRESPDSLVPIDRDPVPPQFAEGVRRYYERLGSGR